jgi:hypothetical protein
MVRRENRFFLCRCGLSNKPFAMALFLIEFEHGLPPMRTNYGLEFYW